MRPLVFAEKFIGCGVGTVIGRPAEIVQGLVYTAKRLPLRWSCRAEGETEGVKYFIHAASLRRYNLRQYSGGNRAEEHQQEYEPGIGGSTAAGVERINAPEHTGYHANIETGEG